MPALRFAVGFLLCLIAAPSFVAAQSSVRIVVPLGPGSQSDTLTRTLAEPLSAILGLPVVVDNRPGAGGTIASESVARAAPDGSTLMLAGIDHIVYSFISANRPALDPFKDLSPIAVVVRDHWAIAASPAVGVKSLAELVTRARAQPGTLSYASFGEGSVLHLLAATFSNQTSIDVIHVPYKEAWMPDLLAGRVSFVVMATGAVAPLIKSGKLTGLAVLSPDRLEALPAVPTTTEVGLPKLIFRGGQAMYAPGGTPTTVVQRMNAAINRALRDPVVRSRYAELGVETAESTPVETVAMLRAQMGQIDEMRRAVLGKAR